MIKLFLRLLVPAFLFLPALISAQGYMAEYSKWKESYLHNFTTSENSPLKKSQLKHLRFFDPDSSFRVRAQFKEFTDKKTITIPTSSGKNKSYKVEGMLTFKIREHLCTLMVYKRILPEGEPENDYCFVPFKDHSNGDTSYGGGRYLDIECSALLKEELFIDFNKAYNPYCAYTDGYSCPVPPEENHLNIEVAAGEKKFGGKSGH